MARVIRRSDHCLIDRPIHMMAFGAVHPLRRPLLRICYAIDPKMHFSMPRCLLWKMVGVDRSTKNPNICTLWGMGWEAGRLSEVTILFADLRNYTTLTTTLGAERVAALMDKYFRAAYAAIVNRDGIVDKFMGDGLLAWFNCPIRHEDHVQRALAAASELQIIARELGTELSKDTPLELGIAVSTGFAVTGRIGSNHPSDYTAVGNIVNLAARLQGEAASGQTILTGEVHKQVGHLLPQAQQVVCSLKGYDKPVTAYTLEEIPKGLVSG